MGATIIKIKLKEEPIKDLTVLQKKLLPGPTLTKNQASEFEKNLKWMRKQKA